MSLATTLAKYFIGFRLNFVGNTEFMIGLRAKAQDESNYKIFKKTNPFLN
ncbi:hypothetical protein GCM10027164_22870 [Algoriphagus taiwanensis]